jgi:hypothetical protein
VTGEEDYMRLCQRKQRDGVRAIDLSVEQGRDVLDGGKLGFACKVASWSLKVFGVELGAGGGPSEVKRNSWKPCATRV